MKIFISFILFFTFLQAQEDEKQTLTLGLGPYIQTQPYKDVNDIVVPSPVIFYDNGIFYIRWSRAGIYFLGKKTDSYAWGFSLTAQPRPNSYKPSEAQTLQGLDEKYSSLEAGLAFSAAMNDMYIETMLLTDVLGRYDSWIVKTEIGYDFEISKLKFYPSIIAIYQSQKFINYYYGVSKKEAQDSIYDEYRADNGLQLGVQTYIKYPFTEKLSMLANIRYDRLSKEATRSPIVEENYIASGLLSLIYTFEY
ncbi:MAG: MipA/OmpV family protein [Campylobacterota bacterium]|nr:MipA/OmpV family protein [Campylobacterota bacterium]